MKQGARIVFDLDGTLIDSAADIHSTANIVLAQQGAGSITLQQTRDFIGNGADVFVTKMRQAAGIADQEHTKLLTEFIALYEDAVSLTCIYPGVEAALEKLTANGHALGICTNKPIRPAQAVLKHLKLANYFSSVWGGDSLSVRKPDPAPLHAAFNELPDGVEVYVGDSEVDAETAARASVPFLLYTEGYRKQAIENMSYTVSFSHFRELPALIEAL